MALKHFPWVYYMILCHAGPPWGLFRGPGGPCGPLKRPQGGPIWHIIMYYAPEKCFMAIWGHAGTFWVMKALHWSIILGHEEPFWAMKGNFGGILGHFGAPVGLWKGPRLVQHDIISCNIPVRSILRPFGVMQGHFGSWRAILGHEGPFLVLLWAIMGPPWASEKGPGWSNMTYNHVIYPWEVF